GGDGDLHRRSALLALVVLRQRVERGGQPAEDFGRRGPARHRLEGVFLRRRGQRRLEGIVRGMGGGRGGHGRDRHERRDLDTVGAALRLGTGLWPWFERGGGDDLGRRVGRRDRGVLLGGCARLVRRVLVPG